MNNFKKSALVVAHPDDELLWFSSIISNVDKIIIVYNKTQNQIINKGRNKIFNSKILPYSNKLICLKLDEANVFNKSNWKFPIPTKYGLKINSKKYKYNFEKLCIKLLGELKNCSNVITHNPWGEYGHEEHSQVFKAVEKISTQLNYSIWVSGYFSFQSFNLMSMYRNLIDKKFYRKKIDYKFCKKVQLLYSSKKCWTWSDEYIWPQYESFFKITRNFLNLKKRYKNNIYSWDQMNLVSIYKTNITKYDYLRSKIIIAARYLLPQFFFKKIVKFNKKYVNI